MENDNYLLWLTNETPTAWWHDSADPDELGRGLELGASGVTTNPVLIHRALRADEERWYTAATLAVADLRPKERAECLMRAVVCSSTKRLEPEYQVSMGAMGYVCAQVDPTKAGDREAMLAMARRYHAWAPNIAVKLPVTAAGLDVLEECIAEGITVTATVSFTVPQVMAVAERHRRGVVRARHAGVESGHCFAVIMIGRLDDYLRDVARDSQTEASETDIQQAGLAVVKRAYAMYKSEGYSTTLLVAALRGTYHATELAGAELIMSIHPHYQTRLLEPGVPREQRIGLPIEQAVTDRLHGIAEFVRAYEPDGMLPEEFITFGATQKTLSQFNEAGWAMLETFDGF